MATTSRRSVTRRCEQRIGSDLAKKSPGIDTDQPVSGQHERNGAPPEAPREESGDIHLRSAAEVRGYTIQGSDDQVGFVGDFIVDDETWELRYLVIDTGHWWWGKKVLVAPGWATRVSWEESKLRSWFTLADVSRFPPVGTPCRLRQAAAGAGSDPADRRRTGLLARRRMATKAEESAAPTPPKTADEPPITPGPHEGEKLR
jgi:hypothetical protein